ncbi:hypothetical protein C9374_009912 [Naegleria lovaniensis]|uniref:Mitochondrial inner membrane protease ATP23 n=1 Tax=Naegleria lovaniensis TaxID=51637 RepID=A0AA88KGH3_NAELO|nr:uncharacterized protein C9374_009912 [Naegleria lovaniensis]KAG2375289.1 hypothetical protein C9374_009912 [Naegleria lovaniensis]
MSQHIVPPSENTSTNDSECWIGSYFRDCIENNEQYTPNVQCDEKVQEFYRTLISECGQQISLQIVECDNNARAYYQRRFNHEKQVEERSIIVCKNHVLEEKDLNEVLRHELIHAIDDSPKCSTVNLRNLHDRSCSEIRAAYWAECGSLLRPRSNTEPSKVHYQCVKHTAMQSVKLDHPFELVPESVKRMMWKCYNSKIRLNSGD